MRSHVRANSKDSFDDPQYGQSKGINREVVTKLGTGGLGSVNTLVPSNFLAAAGEGRYA